MRLWLSAYATIKLPAFRDDPYLIGLHDSDRNGSRDKWKRNTVWEKVAAKVLKNGYLCISEQCKE
jgi:hypothetical protein